MRVGVIGAGGKVGSTICRAVLEHPSLELVAAVDPRLAGIDLGQVLGKEAVGLMVARDVRALVDAGAEVAIDFTQARAAAANLLRLGEAGVAAVVGTTGLAEEELAAIAEAYVRSGTGCVVASNFSIGAILLMRVAALVAPYFDSIEIVETHHEHKLDAPSGTALEIARRVMEARAQHESAQLVEGATELVRLDGARGAALDGGLHIHSVRLRGAVAHHEVVFGAEGQTLTVRHDSFDRASFVPGVMLAVERVREVQGLVRGIEGFL